MELPTEPCPTARCAHRAGCGLADRRRAEAGHTGRLVKAPKMDAPKLVAAVCSCGRYQSGPSSPRGAASAWRDHADAKTPADRPADPEPAER